MKKSILNIILLVLVLTNTILTGILVFVLIKPMQDTNRLVNKICKALDLELEIKESVNLDDIPIDQIKYFDLAGESGKPEKMTIPLKRTSDGKQHYAQMSISLGLYTKHKDFSKYESELENQKAVISQHIQDVVQKYTYSEMLSNPEIIRKEAVKELQKLYDSEFIVEVIFNQTTLQ